MIQKLLLFLSLILFLLTLQYTVWPGLGAIYRSGLESTMGHHALKHKYHLPLTPPPPKLCVFCSKSSPNLYLPSNLVRKFFSNFWSSYLVKKNFLKKIFLLGFTTFY